MRASALLLVLAWGCTSPTTEVEPVMKALDGLDTPESVEVAGAVGSSTVEVPVRLLNGYGAAVPGGELTVSVDGETATLADTTITVDSSGYAVARVTVAGAEAFTLTVDSTDVGVSGGASATAYGVVGALPALALDRGALLPALARNPDFMARAADGFAVAAGNTVWFIPEDSGHPAHAVATLPYTIAGMWAVHLDTDGVDDLVLWGEDEAVFLRGREGGGYSWGGGWSADAGDVVGVAVDDLDGDRLPDVAIGMSTENGGSVQILTGDGAWAFEPTDTLELNFEILAITAADEGNDGTAEVTVLQSSTGYLRRYTQSEEGWIGASGPELGEGFLDEFAEAEGTVLMPAADLDDDGDEDYILIGPMGTSQTLKFLTIDDEVTYYTRNYNQGHPVLANMNGASPTELVVLSDDADGADLKITAFQGAGSDPLFRERGVFDPGSLGPIAVADADDDGVADLAVGADALHLYAGLVEDDDWENQTWTWRAYDANLAGPYVFADFDDDGLIDFASLTNDSGAVELEIWSFSVATGEIRLVSGDDYELEGLDPASLTVCEEDGDYIFYALVSSGSTNTLHRLRYEPATTDLSLEASVIVAGQYAACGDFAPGDVAVSNSAGAWVTYYYSSTGTLALGDDDTESIGTVYAVTAADTDGDGDDDLVGCGQSDCTVAAGDLDGDGADEIIRGGSSVSLEDGGETWSVDGAGTVSIVDADGDALMDALAVDAEEGRIYLYRGVAGGLTPPVLLHTTREIGGYATLGDVNGDGAPELVVEGSGGAMVHSQAD